MVYAGMSIRLCSPFLKCGQMEEKRDTNPVWLHIKKNQKPAFYLIGRQPKNVESIL